MSQAIELSDELILDAHQASKWTERSTSEQIELWAELGRAIEPLIGGDRATALRRSGAQKPLSKLIQEVDSEKGRNKVRTYLDEG